MNVLNIRSLIKASALTIVGGVMAFGAIAESSSQLPGGETAKLQLPLLVTSATLSISRDEKERIFQRALNEREAIELTELGRKRLRAEPLDPLALLLISLDRDNVEAGQILTLANAVSRRERLVQIQLIRFYAENGNLSATIKHLDYLLTVSPSVAPDILSRLVQELKPDETVRLFKRYSDRPWYGDLINQALLSPKNTATAAELLLKSKVDGEYLRRVDIPNIVNRLANQGDLKLAGKVVKFAYGINLPAQDVFGPNRKNVDEAALPMSWLFINDGNVSAELIEDGVAVTVRRGLGGIALKRVTGYDPGRYALNAVVSDVDGDARFTWRLSCSEGGEFREKWSYTIGSNVTKGIDSDQVAIPQSCFVQQWILYADNNVGVSESAIILRKIRLKKLDVLDLRNP